MYFSMLPVVLRFVSESLEAPRLKSFVAFSFELFQAFVDLLLDHRLESGDELPFDVLFYVLKFAGD